MMKQGLSMQQSARDPTASPSGHVSTGATAAPPVHSPHRHDVGIPRGSLELSVEGVGLAVAREGKARAGQNAAIDRSDDRKQDHRGQSRRSGGTHCALS